MSLAAENDTLTSGKRRVKLVNFDKARQTREALQEPSSNSQHQPTADFALAPATDQFHPRKVKLFGFEPHVEKLPEIDNSSSFPPSVPEPVLEDIRPFPPVRNELEPFDARKSDSRDEEPITGYEDFSPICNEPVEEIQDPIDEREDSVGLCPSPIRDRPEVDLSGYSPSEREAIRYRLELQEKLHRMTYGD